MVPPPPTRRPTSPSAAGGRAFQPARPGRGRGRSASGRRASSKAPGRARSTSISPASTRPPPEKVRRRAGREGRPDARRPGRQGPGPGGRGRPDADDRRRCRGDRGLLRTFSAPSAPSSSTAARRRRGHGQADQQPGLLLAGGAQMPRPWCWGPRPGSISTSLCDVLATTAADNRHLHNHRAAAQPGRQSSSRASSWRWRTRTRPRLPHGARSGRADWPWARLPHRAPRGAMGHGLAEEDQGACIKPLEKAAGVEARRRKK